MTMHKLHTAHWKKKRGVRSGSNLNYLGYNTFLVQCLQSITYCGHFYQHGLTLIQAWINNYMPSKIWDEITYPFLNLTVQPLKFRNG